MENTYWNSNGKYQLEADELTSLVPIEGSVKGTGPFSRMLEAFRIISNIYHDYYNNGGGNLVDAIEEECYDDDEPAILEWELNEQGSELFDSLSSLGFHSLSNRLKKAIVENYEIECEATEKLLEDSVAKVIMAAMVFKEQTV